MRRTLDQLTRHAAAGYMQQPSPQEVGGMEDGSRFFDAETGGDVQVQL